MNLRANEDKDWIEERQKEYKKIKEAVEAFDSVVPRVFNGIPVIGQIGSSGVLIDYAIMDDLGIYRIDTC